ncbi:hypothetical protein ABDK56_04315 [Sphingomonas sp. ASV193]|uniref:hypothetical protein n=1 Tax=Sphingomonas sp. ASV193 TaxID=3144405 RepID=UPI0032E88CE1
MRRAATLLVAGLLAACGRHDPPSADKVDRTAEATSAPVGPANAVTVAPDDRRHSALTAVKAAAGETAPDARVALAFADIGGDAREEAIAYLVDSNHCGTGGCSLIVLTPSGKGWKTLAQTSVTQLPVNRLLTRKDGWNDLAVAIGGGGGKAGIALLRFANGRYPDNPSVEPILNRLPEGARRILPDDHDHLVPLGG